VCGSATRDGDPTSEAVRSSPLLRPERPGLLTLALETSTEWASAALFEGGRELAVWRLHTHQDLLRRLSAEINLLLARAGRTIGDLGLVAVGLGPGSFTSLRVGLATAKGIGLARGAPLVGIPSLAALIWPARAGLDSLACPLLDARRGELYAGFFRALPEGVARVGEEFVAAPLALAARVAAAEEPVTIFGDASLPAVAELALLLRPRGSRFLGSPSWPDASAVAELGQRAFAARGADDLDSLRPIYVRRSYAEEKSDIDLGLR
jgi:tRNA threonylcarbamoyladenosine biosynthesis protein TsaB